MGSYNFLLTLLVISNVVNLAAPAVCGYGYGSLLQFEAFIGPNGRPMKAEDFIKSAGPMWAAFAPCNQTDFDRGFLNATHRVGRSTNLTVSLFDEKKFANVTRSKFKKFKGIHRPKRVPGVSHTLRQRGVVDKAKDAIRGVFDLNCNAHGGVSLGRRFSNLEERANRRATGNPPTGFAQCIPLVSTNPMANPYHELLTGMKNTAVRNGAGWPIETGVKQLCPKTEPPESCRYTKSTTTTITNSVTYSMSIGSSKTLSNVLGSSWSVALEDSTAVSISDSIENSLSKATTEGESGSFSTTVSSTLTKTHEESTANTKTISNERSTTNTKTWDTSQMSGWSTDDGWTKNENRDWGLSHASTEESNWAVSNENRSEISDSCTESDGGRVSASAGFNGLIVHGEMTAEASMGRDKTTTGSTSKAKTSTNGGSSSTNNGLTLNFGTNTGQTHNSGRSGSITQSFGGSDALTVGRTESDSTETRRSDSISDAFTNSATNERGWQTSATNTVGSSLSHQVGTSTSRGRVDNKGGETSETRAAEQSIGNESSNTTTTTLSVSVENTMPFSAGTCVYSACLPEVESVSVPWACKDEDGDVSIVSTEVQKVKYDANNKVKCVEALVQCSSKTSSFTLLTPDYITRTLTNSLSYGDVLTENSKLISNNGIYTLSFLPGKQPGDGASNLALRRYENLIEWETGVLSLGHPIDGEVPSNPSELYTQTRFRITDDGHLVQEAKNFFINGHNNDGWFKVWSSVPMHLNYTIGVMGDIGYVLTLQDDGNLVLIDGVGATIWMSGKACAHRLGYKYPDDYLVPTFRETDGNAPKQIDPHNSIPADIKFIGTSLKSSLTGSACGSNTVLRQNQGLLSPNRRFKFYLLPTGNAIFKDGTRTMWQTKTSDMWFADPNPTYSITLSPKGQMLLRDQRGVMIWQSYNPNNVTEVPYTVSVTDDGNLVVTDDVDATVWQSWPVPIDENHQIEPDNVVWRFSRPVKVCGDPCFPCSGHSTPKPLIHLLTDRCLGLKGMGPCDGSEDQMWIHDEEQNLYRHASDLTLCLGSPTGIVGPCSPLKAWEHYSDGFMSLAEYQFRCLGKDGLVVKCDDTRLDKLWSHGRRYIKELNTRNVTENTQLEFDRAVKAKEKLPSDKPTIVPESKMILLPGERLSNGTATFRVSYGGQLFLEDPETGLNKTLATSARGGPFIAEISRNGTFIITDMIGSKIAFRVPISKGSHPFTLTVEKSSRTTRAVLKDSKTFVWQLTK